MQPNKPQTAHLNPQRPSHAESIIQDNRALEGKRTLMKSMRSNSLLNGIGAALMMTGGPLFATGLIEFGKAFAGSAATGFFAKLAATAALPAVEGALTLMAVGAIIAATAVAVNYVASRKWQSSNIDSTEYNAQMTAHHMAKEFEKKGLVVTPRQALAQPQEYDNPPRSDNKTWQKATGTSQSANRSWQQDVTEKPQSVEIYH